MTETSEILEEVLIRGRRFDQRIEVRAPHLRGKASWANPAPAAKEVAELKAKLEQLASKTSAQKLAALAQEPRSARAR